MNRHHVRVRRLSGLDAGFLSMELPEQPMNTMALAILRPPGAADGASVRLTLDDIRRHVAMRLDALPAFRLVVKSVPLGLHHPVLVDAATFDLDDHLHQAALPAPGGDAELDRLYADLAAQHLDRRHPLWRLTLVDGLEGGRQALILQLQHCLMDGAGTALALASIFSADDHNPNAGSVWRPARAPSGLRLLVGGLGRQGRVLARVPGLVRRTRRSGAAAAARASQSGIAVPRGGVDAPACSINKGFTAERRFARVTVELADVAIVKEAAEGTVNDVVLAMVAGSLRRYLLARNDLPGRPLVATVPVGIDGPASADVVSGNRLSHLITSLATDIAEPWERLGRIREITRESKTRLQLTGPEILNDWLEVFPPFFGHFAYRRSQRRRQTGDPGLVANVLVSNLRGPPQPWTFGPAVVEEAYMTGSPNGGLGVTIMLWDYAGKLRFGVLATADSVDDASEIVEGLRASLQELVAIAQRLLQDRSPTR